MPRKAQTKAVSLNHKDVNDAPAERFTKFLGINNVDSPINIGPQFLPKCTDFDNYRDGRLILRGGQTLITSGASKNIFSNFDESVCLYMKGGNLMRLNPDETSTIIASGFNPNLRMRYCDGDARIWMTNGEEIGYFKDGNYYGSSTFNDPLDYYKIYPLVGDDIEYGLSRLWVTIGDTVFYSDGSRPMQFDLKNNYMRFSGALTLFKVVTNGIWISDGYIRFLFGTNPKQEMRMITKAEYPAIRYANTRLTGDEVGEEGHQDLPVCCATPQGVCVLGVDGSFKNVTEKKYNIPQASLGSALYRPAIGLNKVIFTLQY